ncbi:PSD1 and planctomycete cytochrome C domain-containing protein [Segetibacter koreensis]|uniref:PSD1 and planctomycete cytochrome C domain-containing protein n=1 Tax=Segetibacter koreensis TaxID=398037 RepID=UPI000381A16A|nr:PSD1 and planctomycete cytochrome C domain-containing protein [Segetibacter koreensis]
MKKVLVLLLISISGLLFIYTSSCNSVNNSDKVSSDESISYNFQVRPILSDKCFNCHGPDANKRQAGLRLDIAEEAYKALQEHPRAHALVPGKPELSELFVRVSSTDTAIKMPPTSSNLPGLSETEIAIIKKWIEQGAKYEKHWAFTAPKKAPLPLVKNKEWPKNEIDYFVLKQLEEKKLTPNDEADKERLLKRISFDLTGLPPTPEQTDAFLKDNSTNAYEKMVDQLLKQPSYGERMAIPWLDVARYADSHGYQDDNYRTQWPWRDWVIHAFNNNMPYDQFITWQLAGDLLPNATKEQLLATGFNRNHKITEEGGVIDEEYRVMYVDDRVTTLGRGILGATIECAKCHDHKFDPFSQKEYYQMSAFFNNIKEVGIESTVGGRETYAKNPRMEITNDDLKGILHYLNKTDTNKLEVSIMKDRDTLRKTFILLRGNYDQHGDEVEPSTPHSILPFPKEYPHNRLGLSKWLFNPQNPLTARVFVNRLWQEFFGKGIVKSAADFGMQGSLPSHPALLDWLAVDFREHGWDIKRLVKQIVMSATYRQSAIISKEKLKADPENVFYSYAPRIRMQAELVKDMVLESSGLLNKTIGGPSIKPYQPAGLWEMATSGRGQLATYKQDTGQLLYRRGMYTFIKRTVPPPNMIIFDASNRDQCEVKRSHTNTPLQALVMMNDPIVLEASLALSDHLLTKYSNATEAAISNGFRRIVCRKPDDKEIKILFNYWKERHDSFAANPDAANKVIKVGEYKPAVKSNVDLAAMMQVMQVIYNMEEAITKT